MSDNKIIQKVIRMGHPTLRKLANKVELSEIQSQAFKDLINDMYDTMKKEGGIGIAAPQINVSKQLALIEIPENNERYGNLVPSGLLIIINPEITYLDQTLQGFYEGCLSVPGLRGYVERPRKIQVDYIDELGKKQVIIAENFLATVFQHELDHLFGVLYIDRITDLSKLAYSEEYQEFLMENKTDSSDNEIE